MMIIIIKKIIEIKEKNNTEGKVTILDLKNFNLKMMIIKYIIGNLRIRKKDKDKKINRKIKILNFIGHKNKLIKEKLKMRYLKEFLQLMNLPEKRVI